MSYRVRRAEDAIAAALDDTRVVAVTGARQVGKSTLVKHVVRTMKNTVVRRLDLPATR